MYIWLKVCNLVPTFTVQSDMNTNNEHLKTIHHYSKMRANNCTVSYIYKLIGEGRIVPEVIDGMKFIDTKKYPSIKEV